MKDNFKALERAFEKDLEHYAARVAGGAKLTPQSSSEIANQALGLLALRELCLLEEFKEHGMPRIISKIGYHTDEPHALDMLGRRRTHIKPYMDDIDDLDADMRRGRKRKYSRTRMDYDMDDFDDADMDDLDMRRRRDRRGRLIRGDADWDEPAMDRTAPIHHTPPHSDVSPRRAPTNADIVNPPVMR